MLQKLFIKNFQIHRDISFLFHKGVNVISGTSGSGKSACIRAIQWVLKNRPSGNSIKNTDSKDEKVEVEISLIDNQIVSKERKNDKAKYIINDDAKNSLDAIGRDVPSEVSSILNISDYNIQGQHDQYFLVQDSPGERAKQLNIFTGMEVIDTLYFNLNSQINTTQKELKKSETSKKEIEIDLEKYSNLEEIEAIINSLKLSFALCEKYEGIVSGINASMDEIFKTEVQLQETKDFLSLEKEVNKIIELISEVKENDELQTRIITSISLIEEDEDRLREYEKILVPEKEVELFLNSVDKYIEIVEEKEALTTSINLLEEAEVELQEIDDDLRIMEKRNNYLLKELGMCPFCGNKIKE